MTGRPPAAGSDLLTAGYGTRFSVIRFLVATFNFADRSVFVATAQTIKQDLGAWTMANSACCRAWCSPVSIPS